MFSLVAMTGCPSEFGREGRIAKAIHQDSMELVRKHCSEDQLKEYCGSGQENSERCRQKCGG
jgi:hypothetical protein